MFGWTAADTPLLVSLPLLLILSGLFSGSETALFGLSAGDRAVLRRRSARRARTVEALLAEPRMLLITILLGNMTANVLYFVISSVLLMHAEVDVIGDIALAVGSLLGIVLLGEVLPKLIASTHPLTFVKLIATPLRLLHEIIGPLRIMLSRLVITPLARLTSPTAPPPGLHEEELQELLALAGNEGAIDRHEHQLLRDVIRLSRRKVRDVMTPRVRIVAVNADANAEEVRRLARATRVTRLPVYEGNLDHIVGLLHVKSYLTDARSATRPAGAFVGPVRFVPDMARLDQLLDHFRATHSQVAVVVDEYGGTSGLVDIEDVVEEIVGDIAGDDEQDLQRPMIIGLSRWRVGGEMSIHDFTEAFGEIDDLPPISTVNGLIAARLGRAPTVGDEIDTVTTRVFVREVDGTRVTVAEVTLLLTEDDVTEDDS